MSTRSLIRRVGQYKQELAHKILFGGEQVVSIYHVRAVAREIGYRFRVRRWPPWLTVLGFLTQTLEQDQSCRNAVAKIWAWLAVLGGELVNSDTGPYCDARKRLPEALLSRLAFRKAADLEVQVQERDLWHGRAVRIVDGGCVSMPDTSENQKAYPQPSVQKKGCGFPVARIVALFSLCTGAILGLEIGSLHVGELVLSHGLWPLLSAGEILLGDRGFSAYADIFLLAQKGVDTVFRLHQRRTSDFRKGRRLGKNDRLVTWTKCRQYPTWLGKEAWKQIPDRLTLREIRFAVDIPGFRSRIITVVTTLLDPIVYPREELIELYRDRWQCELNFRSVKAVMKMDVLRCKTPAMVRKEIYVHLLAYNMVRGLMYEASRQTGQVARRLSFTGTLQALNAFWPLLIVLPSGMRRVLYKFLLLFVGREELPFRPNRIEPRKVKRRPKPYSLLTEPRQEARRREKT